MNFFLGKIVLACFELIVITYAIASSRNERSINDTNAVGKEALQAKKHRRARSDVAPKANDAKRSEDEASFDNASRFNGAAKFDDASKTANETRAKDAPRVMDASAECSNERDGVCDNGLLVWVAPNQDLIVPKSIPIFGGWKLKDGGEQQCFKQCEKGTNKNCKLYIQGTKRNLFGRKQWQWAKDRSHEGCKEKSHWDNARCDCPQKNLNLF